MTPCDTDRLPGVSVVVPARNAERTIRATIASLMAQTLCELEIICVDDSSTDATLEVLLSLAQRDSRIKVIALPRNLGVHMARATGIRSASREWVGFLDADDVVEVCAYEKLVSASISERADIVVCGSKRVSRQGSFLGHKVRFSAYESVSDNIFERFCSLEFGTGALWNKLYRLDVIRDWGTRPHRWLQNGTEDTLVNIGCFWEAGRVVILPDVLHHYVLEPGSLTSDLDPQQGCAKIIRAFAVAVDLYAHLGSKALAGIADLYRAQLAYPSYAISWQGDLPQWIPDLDEPLRFLAIEHPQALALLLARLPTADPPGLGSRLRALLRRLKPIRHG